MAVTEIAEVDEIVAVAGKDDIAELEVAVEGRVRIGHPADVRGDPVLLVIRKERIGGEQAQVAVLDILEQGRIHMRGMQLPAHPGEKDGVVADRRGIVADGAGIGALPADAAEAQADPLPVRHQVAGLGRRNARREHLPGGQQLIERLGHVAPGIELQQDIRVGAVVVAGPVGPFAGKFIIRQVNRDGTDVINHGKRAQSVQQTPGRQMFPTVRTGKRQGPGSARHGTPGP